MERCIRKSFWSLELKDLYHGGHHFHPYGRYDWSWFMVDVMARGSKPGMDVPYVVYLPTYPGVDT